MVKYRKIKENNISNEHQAYSDVEFIQGLLYDRQIQYELYKHWRKYFSSHCMSEFFHLEGNIDLIIHNAYIVLWDKVRLNKIYVKDGILYGYEGKPFEGKLTTYLMSIARNNNRELLRDIKKTSLIDDFNQNNLKNGCKSKEGSKVLTTNLIDQSPFLIPSEENVMCEILSEIIQNMSKSCNQILTMFYYKEMKLDCIMNEIKSYKSKNALKTAKNKCMEKLKIEANKRYNDFLNS